MRQEVEGLQSALIFCNRKTEVALLQRSLARHGFDAKALHGDMSQPARMETLESFRDGKVKILVCSDVAARGLDIPAVSHVFNFDVPVHAEDYIHRIGRTGRAGRSGKAFMLVTPADAKLFAAVTRLLGRTLPEGQKPEALDEGMSPVELATEAAPAAEEKRERRPRRSEKPKRESRREPKGKNEDKVQPAVRAERTRGEAEPSNQAHNPTASFGDHTPAFLLRPMRQAAG
jgi:superfamily II DNA/RNA helicase